MDLFSALTYPFEYKGWPGKLLMAILIAAFPFVGYFLIMGWEYDLSARVLRREPDPLPRWGNLLSRLWQGIKIRAADFIYNIPTFVLIGISLALWIRLFIRWWTLGPGARSFSAFGDMFMDTLATRLTLIAITLLYAFVANTLFWSGYLRYIRSGRWATFFEIVENLKLSFSSIWDDIVLTLYTFAVGVVVWGIGIWLGGLLSATGLGTVLAFFLIPGLSATVNCVVKGHLIGQLALRTFEPVQSHP